MNGLSLRPPSVAFLASFAQLGMVVVNKSTQ